MTITQNRFFLSDFVSIQRDSFLQFLEKGLIEEISKRNPITNNSNTLEVFFYSEYYQLSAPKYSPRQAILKGKSYASRLYIPVQLTDRKARKIQIKWVYLCDLPIMTKRGHFIINGAARVIINQIIRSPGIYYQTKIYENYKTKWDQTPESSFERKYVDLICQRGTWLRIEIDKDKKIWGQTKKGPKIPIMWLLLAMGLSEKTILTSIIDPIRLLYNMFDLNLTDRTESTKETEDSEEPLIAWDLNKLHGPNSVEYIIQNLEILRKVSKNGSILKSSMDKALIMNKDQDLFLTSNYESNLQANENNSKNKKKKSQIAKKQPKSSLKLVRTKELSQKQAPEYITTPPEAWAKIYTLFAKQKTKKSKLSDKNPSLESASNESTKTQEVNAPGLTQKKDSKTKKGGQQGLVLSELGRQFIFNKFMNPRTYDLSKYGRLNFNKKLNLSISPNHTTLTPQDLLAATNHLLKVEYGLKKVDDIDNLKNRRVRTSGELIQIQFGTGLLRLEKSINEKMTEYALRKPYGMYSNATVFNDSQREKGSNAILNQKLNTNSGFNENEKFGQQFSDTNTLSVGNPNIVKSGSSSLQSFFKKSTRAYAQDQEENKITINQLIPNTKAVNSALREFFGTSPLSQFMDQINPLAEITHKRRLSSMGPGGVTRDSATLEIRGIHPSHYGRICPVETPEGKNTGLVNSLTTYAKVNKNGYIETPFYKVFKGQVQKKMGMYFFSADKEEKIRLGAADLFASDIGFLDKDDIPVRIQEDFTKISRTNVEYAGVSPSQMVSIATSLIPFLEHDDANRALMGSNMQRQAVPILNPERPIVGTGLESRVVCDSGHALEAKKAGIITYVSADKIVIYAQNE